MRRKKIITIKLLRRILVYLFVFSLPILAKRILNAGIPVYVIVFIMAIKFIFEELSLLQIKKIYKNICRIFSAGISVLFAIALLISIIITPASIYSFFFEQAHQQLTEEYFVATLFVLLITFFCMFFGSACLKQNSLKHLLGLFSIISGLLLIIYQTMLYLFLLIAGLFIYIAVLMKKRVISLTIVFVICIGISLLIYVVWSKPEGSRLVDNFLFPETRQFINSTFPQFPLLIDIPGYGMNFGTNRLGGRAILTSAPVFEVQANNKETIYLKTSIYDKYTGNSWIQTEKTIDIPGLTFGTGAMNGVIKTKDMEPEDSDTDSITVKILSEVFSMVPYTLDTQGFKYKGDYYKIAGNTYVPGIAFPGGIKRNDTITLYRKKEYPGTPENLNMFLQVPENLPDSVKDLSNILGQNASSRQEILYNIQAFLAAYYTYNLDPPVAKKDEDFLEKFLFKDKEGYCTHFATAFAIFARLNRIPVRYATGYLVYITDDSYKKIATAQTAHAWPEIWLPKMGWHIWESTRAVNRNYYTTYLEGMYYRSMFESMIQGNGIARNKITMNQLQNLLGIELHFKQEDKKNFTWIYHVLSVLLYIFSIILAVCLAGGLLYLFIRFLINRKPERYWKVLVNRIVTSFRQAPLPEEKGWIHWKNKMCSIYKIEKERADALLAVILKLAYSEKAASMKEIHFLKNFSH